MSRRAQVPRDEDCGDDVADIVADGKGTAPQHRAGAVAHHPDEVLVGNDLARRDRAPERGVPRVVAPTVRVEEREVGGRVPDHPLGLQRAVEDDARRRVRDDDQVGRLGRADDVPALHAILRWTKPTLQPEHLERKPGPSVAERLTRATAGLPRA